MYNPPCPTDGGSACSKANGWPDPLEFNMQYGSAAPEGVFTGYGPASFYYRTTTQKFYAFAGAVHGTKIGWAILN